jgi:hypothetical protein
MLEKLQKQFGVPADALKTRAVPRVIFSYDGADKAQWLALHFSMIVNGVLPDEGQRTKYRRDHRHEELAAATGLKSRSTFTRWMTRYRTAKAPTIHSRRRFAAPNLYSTALPARAGVEYKVSHINTGKTVYGGIFSNDVDANEFCTEKNREAGKILYQVKGRVLDPKCFFYPNAESLAAAVREAMAEPERHPDEPDSDYAERIRRAQVSRMFSQDLCRELKLNGYKGIPKWVWHPNLGISFTARLVLTWYIFCGILETGWVQVHQEKVARACGISIKTLYNKERELERVGLIRVVGQKRLKQQGLGMYPDWRSLNKILLLPIRTMTDEEIKAERWRMLRARRELHQVRKMVRMRFRRMRIAGEIARNSPAGDLAEKRFTLALQSCTCARIHRSVVESLKGQTTRVNVIWDAARQKLQEAGIEPRLIAALIPHVVAPPGLDGRPVDDGYRKAVEIRAIIERSLKNNLGPRE